MQIKAVFWDNDGVLVDTEPIFWEANQEVLKKYGIDVEASVYQERSLRQGKSVLDQYIGQLGQKKINQIREERDLLYSKKLKQGVHLRPGVLESIQRLHGKVKQAIVTSSRKIHFDIIHQVTGILSYFDLILTREDYKFSKPNPEPYLKALTILHIEPEEAIVVEDTERGLNSASSAGISCYVIPTYLTEGSDFSKALKVLSSAKEIAEEVLGRPDIKG